MTQIDGLNGRTSVGRCGGFSHGDHARLENTSVGLNTCVVHGLNLFAFGENGALIGAPAVGWEHSVTLIDRSWTGMALNCSVPDADALRIDYRTTLPGVLYTAGGTHFGWDWAVSGSPLSIVRLPGQVESGNRGDWADCGQVFLARTKRGAVLFSCNQPVEKLETISYEHWRLSFSGPGARIMVTPLLDDGDVPLTDEAVARWIAVTEQPPLYCAESFETTDGGVVIASSFSDTTATAPALAPLPPTSVQAGAANGLQALPPHNILLQTVFGPYALADHGSGSIRRRIDTRWMEAVVEPTRDVGDVPDPLPLELAYAGDASWDEKSAMDRLLAWRLWAALYPVLPQNLQAELKRRVPLPDAAAFRAALMERREPVTGRTWLMDSSIFSLPESSSDASYDVDWYSGLTLSGLRRAGECVDPDVADRARALAASVKDARRGMVAYYEIFNDWALGAAWTDARGELFNFDCAHNGMEGLLAERRFRQWEGNDAGAEYMTYLVARMAAVFVVRGFPFGAQKQEAHYGPSHIYEWRRGHDTTGKSRGPYNLAGEFPEFAALLKRHGPLHQLQQQADDYARARVRYDDWLAFYVGNELAASIRDAGADGTSTGRQEAREQAGVFYHVSPDTALRLWILEEDPDAVEALYTAPMPLAAHLLCRAGFRLRVPADVPSLSRSISC
jgi:hypothetical protein